MMDGLWMSIPFYLVLKVLNVGGPRTYEQAERSSKAMDTGRDALPSVSLLTELTFFYRFELSGRVDSRLGVDRDDGRTVDEHSILFSTEGFECRGPTYVRINKQSGARRQWGGVLSKIRIPVCFRRRNRVRAFP